MSLDDHMRVSGGGEREGKGYISPDVQRQAITSYATELNGSIIAWHDDQDYSGGNTKRPGFQAMLELVREIIDRGQIFASCHERIDPRTPEGNYMLHSFFSNAELFLDQIKGRWETAKSRACRSRPRAMTVQFASMSRTGRSTLAAFRDRGPSSVHNSAPSSWANAM